MWKASHNGCGDWFWFLPLPNGWTATVSDHSQAQEPTETTHYHIAAISKELMRERPEVFMEFAEAKDAALQFATLQEDISG